MERPAKAREVKPVVSWSHALDVLEALGRNGEMGVSEISREIELSKTAVYNILKTSRRGGWSTAIPRPRATDPAARRRAR